MATAPSLPAVDPKSVLLGALALVTITYVAILVAALRRARADEAAGVTPRPALLGVGFLANFLDTLGIGSFATTTSIVRHWRMVRDERLPGTLNAGHTLPTIVQAFIYTKIVPVDARTLILMIAGAVLGAWLGAGLVAGWPRRRVQIGMGVALAAAAALMLLAQLNLVPSGGDLLRLEGTRLALGVAGNVVLGALMTIGIGLYAPCMILVSLLGMNPTAAFPIMMGSCAFLMPVASARFIRARSFDPRAVLGFLLGGIPAVLVAAFIVRSLPLGAVRWLVIVVVLYTAVNLLRATRRTARHPEAELATTAKAEAAIP
jgi:uncharacterized membrane protein YfcA